MLSYGVEIRGIRTALAGGFFAAVKAVDTIMKATGSVKKHRLSRVPPIEARRG
jgi:hypothetical protein